MPELVPIPMAEALRAANALVAQGLIKEYAVGGAMAAIFYVEPFATYDIDIFYVPADEKLDAAIPAIYEALQKLGWRVEHDHLVCAGFPVQFLAAAGLTAEAVEKARPTAVEGVPGRIFTAEHIVAIASQVGRNKDKARIVQFLEQGKFDRQRLRDIASRHHIDLEL